MKKIGEIVPVDGDGLIKNAMEMIHEARRKNITGAMLCFSRKDGSTRTYTFKPNYEEFNLILDIMKRDLLRDLFMTGEVLDFMGEE